MTRKLNFAFGGNSWKFQLQDKKERVEERNELFNKLTITPAATNGKKIQFFLRKFSFQVVRQALYGIVDEFLQPTFNAKVFPYHWNDSRVVGEFGWLDSSLLDPTGFSTYIENLEVREGEFVTFKITNPWKPDKEDQLKRVSITSDFVKLVKVSRSLYQAWNDFTFDDKTGLPNATLKMFYRQQLAEGAMIEFYPVVEPGQGENGETYWRNRLQTYTQKLWEWMSEIDKGQLTLEDAAGQYYTAKAVRNQNYAAMEKGIATGAITDEVQDLVNNATRAYSMGEEVEEFGLRVKLEGELTDVSAVPGATYHAIINGRKEWFDTKTRAGRMDLTSFAQSHNGGVELVREPDDFNFRS